MNTNTLSAATTTTTTTNGRTTSNTNIAFNNRDTEIGEGGRAIVRILIQGVDIGINIGYRFATYLTSREIRSLREICTEMCSMLYQTGIFNIRITPDRLQNMRLQDYPKLYPRVKGANDPSVFAPIPIEAVVQNAIDLQTVLKDRRFTIKIIVFRGRPEDLKGVRAALPSSIGAIEIKQEPLARNVTKAAPPTSDNALFNEVIKAVNDPVKQESILSKLSDINVKDKRGFAILHYACIGEDESLVKLLIEKLKSKINEANLDKQTALHLAVSNAQVAIAKYLISQSGDIMAKSSSGQNVLHYAVHHGEKEFIKWLFDQHLNEQQKKQMLAAQDEDGKSVMHYAGLHSDSDLVRFLYQKGANIDDRNKYDYTPLHFAASRNKNPEVIAELIKAGADIGAITVNGDSPLTLAICFNNWKLAEYLGKIELAEYGKNMDPAIKEPLEEGIMSYCEGEWDESEKALFKALQVAEGKKDNFSLCFILVKLGDVYLSKSDYATAAKFYSSAFLLSIKDKRIENVFDEKYFCQKQLSIETRYIREVCEDQDVRVASNFVSYRKMLFDIRNNIGGIVEEGPIKEVLFEITSSLKTIVSDLFYEIFELLGNPLCEYAILGLGSMSRDEMCPYSDIEFAVVVSDSSNEVKKYFNDVLRLLELKVISLGETKFPVLRRGSKSVTKGGLSLDSGGNTPLGKVELIGTLQELTEFQKMNKFKEDIILSNVLKTACLITGNKKLFETYQTQAKEALSSLAPNENFFTGKKLGMQQALELMKGDTFEFAPELNKEQGEVVFNVKKELYRLPSNFISYLSLYHGIKEKNSFERLEVLREKKIISKEGYERLKALLTFSTKLRVKTHLYYSQEEENICHKSIIGSKQVGVYEITDEEAKKLEDAYRVLIPLYEAIREFVESDGNKSFEKKSFYAGNSLYVDATIHEKKGNHEMASQCYNKALQLNPEDLSILLGLIQLKIKLNDFKGIEKLGSQALEIANKKYGKEHDEYARWLYVLANIYKAQGKQKEAINHYLETIRFKNNPKNKVSIVGNSFNELAQVYVGLKELDKAEEYAQESLRFSSEFFGKKSQELVNSLNTLVTVHIKQENYEEAEIHCKSALTLAEAIHGKGSKEALEILDHYGDIYFGYGEVSKALDYYNRAFSLRKIAYGETSLEVAKSHDKLSDLCYMHGEYKKAVDEAYASLMIKANVYKGSHVELTESNSHLSRCYYALNDYIEALKYGVVAIRIMERLCGSNHPNVIKGYCELGNIYYALNDKPQALVCYSKIAKTANISHELLVSFLKNNYRKFSQLQRFITEEECSLINSYINLAIVESPKGKTKEGDKGFRDERLLSYESLYEINESIALKELFDTEKDKTVSKVVVYGRAGIGKTTMCKYIVSRWQHGSLWQNKFEAIFWLPLRELIAYPEDEFPSLVKIIQGKCVGREHITEENIKEFIEKNNSKILFILDGYDEVAQVVGSRKSLKNLLLEVLNNKAWYALLTSRPMQISHIGEQEIKFDKQLENIGFTNENIEAYVKRFAPQESEELVKFLKNNSSIWGIAHVPINLELICSIWESSVKGKEQTEYTMTDLYGKIVEKLLERYLKKFHKVNFKALSREEVQKKTEVVNRVLERLALVGMMNNQIIFSEAMMSELLTQEKDDEETLFNELLATGIIKIMNTASGTKDVHFIHLTFQEYCAAKFIANNLEKGSGSGHEMVIRLIEKYKYTPYCEVMWWYVAGMVYNNYLENKNNIGLKNFWKAIEGGPRDLLGNAHMNLVIKCLDESKADESIPVLKEQLLQVKEWVAIKWKEDDQLQKRLSMSPYMRNNKIVSSCLIEALRDKNWDVSGSVGWALGEIGRNNSEVIDRLLAMLSDEDSDLRSSAAKTLGKIVSNNPEIIKGLLAALNDKYFDVRRSAAWALVRIGSGGSEVINGLITALSDWDSLVKSHAAEALGRMGNGSLEVINGLLAVLTDKYSNDRVKYSVAKALGNIGNGDSEIINALVTLLNDKDSHVKCAAAEVLEKIGSDSSEVINGLLVALNDENHDVNWAAANALGNIGRNNSDVINRLLIALGNQNSSVRIYAKSALVKIGSDSSEVINGLLAALSDKSHDARKSAAEALGDIGNHSSEVINRILVVLDDQDYDVRSSAAYALGEIGGDSSKAIDGLLATLHDKDQWVRSSAAYALEKIGNNSSDVINGLLGALRDQAPNVRRSAARALVSLGNHSSEVISELLAALRDEVSSLKMCTVDALAKTRSGNAEVLKGLITALKDKEWGVRNSAMEALVNIDCDDLEVIKSLLAVLHDLDSDAKMDAAEALGKIGKDSFEVFPITVANEINDNDTIKLLSEKLPIGTLIKCFAISNNHKWIEEIFDSKEPCYLILQGNTLFITVQQKTEKVTLTAEQTKTLLTVLKNYANKRGLSQLINMYDSYLSTLHVTDFSSQSNN